MQKSFIPSSKAFPIALLVGVTAASTGAIFIRIAQANGADSLIIAAARLSIATCLLIPFCILQYKKERQSIRKNEWLKFIFAGLFLALHFISWIKSLEYTSIASSVVLVSTTPLWVAIFSPVFLQERINYFVALGLTIALLGCVIIAASDICLWRQDWISCPPYQEFLGKEVVIGNILALIGAWMAAGYLMVGRNLRNSISLLPYVTIVYGIAAIILIGICLLFGKSATNLSPQLYLWFFMLALIPQILGHSLINWLLKYIPPSFVAITLLGEPIGSTVLAYFIFGEIPGWLKILGSIVTLGGIFISTRRKSTNMLQ